MTRLGSAPKFQTWALYTANLTATFIKAAASYNLLTYSPSVSDLLAKTQVSGAGNLLAMPAEVPVKNQLVGRLPQMKTEKRRSIEQGLATGTTQQNILKLAIHMRHMRHKVRSFVIFRHLATTFSIMVCSFIHVCQTVGLFPEHRPCTFHKGFCLCLTTDPGEYHQRSCDQCLRPAAH